MNSHGNPPRPEECIEVLPFVPPTVFERPADIGEVQRDLRDGTARMYGTPLTEYAQCLYGWEYGVSQMGFDDKPVRFSMNGKTMYVSREGWVIE